MPAADRVIKARAKSDCNVCNRPIAVGSDITQRPGYGWVHLVCAAGKQSRPKPAAPKTAPKPSAYDDLLDDAAAPENDDDLYDDPDDAPAVEDYEPVDVPNPAVAGKQGSTDAAAIERRLNDKLNQMARDQARVQRAMVKDELKTAFDATLPDLLRQITTQVKAATTDLVRAKLEEARNEFKAETTRAIAKIAGSGLVKQVVEIVQPDGSTFELKDEVFHPRFAWILKLASAGKPIFMPGPTGCGKTHLAAQIARALFRDEWEQNFSVLSCSPATAERHFLGRSVPNITTGADLYRSAAFVDRYENGGVFCADEIDAGDASVFLVINAALANNYLPVPDRIDNPIARRHEKFVFVACANTWGTGADRQYVGRNRLDEATLDRFRMGTVPLNYSAAIERGVCPDTDLFDELTGWRANIFANRIERVLSTRFMKDAFEMKQVGAGHDDIRRAFFSGWRREEIIKVLGYDLPAQDD